MKKVNKEELEKIIEKHGKFLRGEEGGERADLVGAILVGADLTGADLTGANLTGADMTGARLDGTKR